MLESGEMYLENILILARESDTVRAVDLSERMAFSKPSVSRALTRLKEDGCVLVDGDGHITLTGKGRAIAEKIYERHQVLTGILTELGVSPENASSDACKMEHDISDETFEALRNHFR